MTFPYEGFEHYKKLSRPLTTYYPEGREALARQACQEVERACTLLGQLLGQPTPEMNIVVVGTAEWEFAPPEETEDPPGPPGASLPYWSDVPDPPWLVIPEQMDEIMGEDTLEKRSLLLYHELSIAFLEQDPRPWPDDNPLWADEWQFQFAAFWLFQQIHGQIENITADLQKQFAESFEPEADGKTPVTVRGFDWYEDTAPEDYLEFVLLLEKFAMDLLARNDATILPRFLERYRTDKPLLSDEVTKMLGEVLGEGGEEWLEELVYF